MKIDLNTAFTYYLKDKHLFKKIIPLYLITICPFIPKIGDFPVLIIGDLLMFFYLTPNINRRIFRPDDNTLYEWTDIGYFLKIGCKTLVPLLICLIPVGIGLIVGYFFLLLGGLAGPQGGGPGLLVILVSFLITFLLVLLCFLPAYLVFTTNLKYKSFFNFKAITFILVNHYKDYLDLLWYYFFLFVLTLIPFLGFLLSPFIFLAFIDINAQFIRQVFKIDKIKNNITNKIKPNEV